MSTSNCGGCEGIGAHRRWCPWVVGARASLLGKRAAEAEALGDAVGGNCPGAANALYNAARLLTDEANISSADYKNRREAEVS